VGGDPAIFLCSHRKIFLTGQIRENSKNMKGRMEERKRRDFLIFLSFI
jgi:hypothetical protein